ncbi:hypothetical protein L1049_009999 [Liquidambar formosana]|uniref:Uncharacterized protein n=1 Tax=Liquidambar formosana TaxID=63359 RepID=A0AAP0R6N0_LIQFO
MAALNVTWMNSQICRDIMLLENQLPYFVLSELYNITKEPTEERSFRERAIRVCANSMLPKPRPLSKLLDRISDDQDIKHLLHLVHVICRPSEPISSENNTGNSKPFSKFLVRISNDQNICSRFKQIIYQNHTRNSRGGQILDQMRSLVELKEFGVRFEKVGKVDKRTDGDDDISIFDVKFDKGLMTVPCFRVEDSTETFFRNLVAYEQHSSDENLHKYFTDFTFFMDQLINSEKDVKLLRNEGIIVNTLGDDKQVANLFNKLTAEVIFPHKSEFSEVRKDVNKHCAKTRNEAEAILKRDYFGSPWTIISTFAAGALLILTVLQTIAAY